MLRLWRRFDRYPGGRALFNILIAKKVPYTGTVKPKVIQLAPGAVTVQMKDSHRVRNHLRSIHAIALANLGEFASGLAMLSALPDSIQAIVTHLEIDYLKKARGVLIAEGSAAPPAEVSEDVEVIVHAVIRDAAHDEVARLAVTWRLRQKDHHTSHTSATAS